ncbi:MAG: prepilin-type N-terminal cleavage/methylation domain-containing protein [bacterium]|nr:prepilin-type N-terminal cleavage/methylation domain-containing protein [bacterium]
MQSSRSKKLTANSLKLKAGFTLIELVIYMGLMAIVVGLFAGILITIVRIQTQQTSSRQVASELNFIMNTITRDIRDSQSLSVTTSTLTITTSLASTTPIIITLDAGAVAKKEGTSATSTLSTSRVVADTLAFTELTNGDSQAVQIILTLSFNTDNPTQEYTQTLQTTAAPLKKAD